FPENSFYMLPLTAVKPAGWLRRQLEIQAGGQSGHLDEFWPSLAAESAESVVREVQESAQAAPREVLKSGWLGGEGESWERGPYFMDGLVPLAFLLDDPELLAKAHKWVGWTLENQRPDGSIGPVKNQDWWPNMVMLKVLAQYQEATGDARVIPLMQKYFRYQLSEIEKRPLHDWAIYRWGENALTAAWLYNRTGDKDLLRLAQFLHDQGYNWTKHYANFRYPRKLSKEETDRTTHVVNNAMAMKYAAIWHLFSNDAADRKAIYKLLSVMDEHHLQPGGVHSGDEHYAGLSPSQGTELCAVVEAMFSLEHLMAIVGDAAFGDRVEKIAFNALPAAISADMWSHQYDQQANQVLCSIHPRAWTTNGPESNLFGLEPNFGCCTANFHQGWPKFVANLWMATPDGGLAAVAYGPSQVKTLVKQNVPVSISEETEYPFRDTIRFTVTPESPVEFPLMLRIPAWAEKASVKVNGRTEHGVKAGSFHRIERKWAKGDQVELVFPMQPRISRWYNNSAAIERGPLVFSLRIGEDWNKIRDKAPAADWEVRATTPWNYALLLEPSNIQVDEKAIGEYPFSASGAPVELHVKGRRLPQWGMQDGSAAPPPQSPVSSSETLETLTLIPYGSAKLRITSFPVLEKK
ncbi:MAG: beta-L-arabinofuranosidase domain-containing protein, partial [Bryobacteraceae bacterium]